MSDLPFVDLTDAVTEDGEIVDEVVLGDNIDLARAAALALEANEQIKLWEAMKARWCGILAYHQIDKRAIYGDALVTLGASSVFNKQTFRRVVEDAGLEDDDLWALVWAGTFSTKDLPQHLAALVNHAKEPGKPYARVSRARKLAPATTEEE